MFKSLDVFPKFSDRSVRVGTVSGGIISIIMVCWVGFLFFGQLMSEFSKSIDSTIVIDTDPLSGPRKIWFNFDMTIDASCTVLHVDSFEEDGSVKTDIIDNITRIRLDESGQTIESAMEKKLLSMKTSQNSEPSTKCGNCYGAMPAGSCCNTCSDVINAFKRKGWSFFGADRWEQCVKEGFTNFGNEKCRIKGGLKVKRGTGHFHIGLGANNVGASKGHSHDISSVKANHSLSHTIKKFKIGEKLPDFDPPLNNIDVVIDSKESPLWVIDYYMHIVPARHFTGTGAQIDSYRYSAMYGQKPIRNMTKKALPGIHFHYDFSPMRVVSQVARPSLRNLVLHMAGIIGGAFSFAAIIDALMFGALSTLRGKRNIGKAE